ncbi:MAG: hypothetical protein ABI690_15275 [Chloroflexota bacterium]
MPITVEWDNPQQTAVLFTYQRPWTWREFDTAIRQTLTLLDGVQHKVDIIFDIRRGGIPPPEAVRHFKSASEITHSNMGQYVYVAPSMLTTFVKNVIQILNRAYGGFGNFRVPDIVFTKSPEEARAFIVQVRQQNRKIG